MEYCYEEFDNFCKKNNIVRYTIVRGTPQLNRLSQRMNKTTMEKVRCLLSNANYFAHLWAKAVMIVAYLINICQFIVIRMKTLEEK